MIFENLRIEKDLPNNKIRIKAVENNAASVKWCFLGSSADEGDGLSPQANSFDDATESDKQFCYLGQTGGEGTAPDYRLF